MRRNFKSDMRLLLGCQLAFPLYATANFVPLGLLYPFTDSLATLFLAIAIFDLFLAFAANFYRRNAAEATLRRSVATWLVVMSPCFAVLFFLLWLGQVFGG